MTKKSYIEVKAEAGVGSIRMVGYVTEWRADLFEMDCDRLLADGINDLDVYLESYGGDAFSGNKIANIIDKFSGSKTCTFGPMVASAGTYIALRFAVRKMPRNGTAMIHKPEGNLKGNVDEIESQVKPLKNVTSDYRATYAKAFSKTEEEISELWKEEYWMNADEALALGLATEIIEPAEVTAEAAAIITAMGSPKAPEATTTQKQTTKNDMSKIPLIAAVYELPESAGEAEILAAAKKNVAALATANAKIKELEAKALTDKEAQVKALVSAAIKDGKLIETERERYEKLAMLDFVEVSAMLSERKPHVSVTSQLGANGEKQTEDKYKGWDFERYQKEAPEVLARIRANEPEKFKELYSDYSLRVNAEAKRG